MEFMHPRDTIAAIATPLGEGGIAVIRISGPGAREIANKIFSADVFSFATHTAHLGAIKDAQGNKVDEALLLVLLGKRSFTGEDTVEIQCHGGRLISRKVLEVVLEAGARLAAPGEFSFRAFLNGKLDLAQAEAIQKLISAKCDKALKLASSQLEGALSKKLETLNAQLLFITSTLEAYIDFPEEGIDFNVLNDNEIRLCRLIEEMHQLTMSFHKGRKIEQGIGLCIVGAPNVGKSSLMNALLEKERAIVTPIAGTTRDTIEENFTLNGLYFRLIDTAGLRNTDDPIEKEGIRRTHNAHKNADIVLLVLDASRELNDIESQLLREIESEKTLLVWNKVDIRKGPLNLAWGLSVEVSAKEQLGLDTLKEAIEKMAFASGSGDGEVWLTSQRHYEHLKHAHAACERGLCSLKNRKYPELLTLELREALFEIGKILGKDVTEDILSTIFSHFCIGK